MQALYQKFTRISNTVWLYAYNQKV